MLDNVDIQHSTETVSFFQCHGGNAMKKAESISTTQAPRAIGPYSQAITAGHFLFVSGQLPINPENGEMVDGDITARAEQVFKNIAAILRSAGGSMTDIVKVTLFLTDMGDFQQVNEVYSRVFQVPYPARSAVQVAALPLGSNIEAEAIAFIP